MISQLPLFIKPGAVLPAPNHQTAQLRSLPVEIIWRILRELPTLNDLYLAVQACRHMYDSYLELHRDIVLSIVGRQASEARGYRVGHIYQETVFAIRHDFISRHAAKAVFELVWDLLQKLRLEEMIIPLGNTLAQTCWAQGSKVAAISILENLWNCTRPFMSHDLATEVLSPAIAESLPRWQPALIPIGRRLIAWADEPEERETIQGQLERLVACQDTLERFVHTVDLQGRKVILQPGRTYTSNSICTICHIHIFQTKLQRTSRPPGTIVWRFSPGEQICPLIDPDDFDADDLTF